MTTVQWLAGSQMAYIRHYPIYPFSKRKMCSRALDVIEVKKYYPTPTPSPAVGRAPKRCLGQAH
jgi:hypothetical protein